MTAASGWREGGPPLGPGSVPVWPPFGPHSTCVRYPFGRAKGPLIRPCFQRFQGVAAENRRKIRALRFGAAKKHVSLMLSRMFASPKFRTAEVRLEEP